MRLALMIEGQEGITWPQWVALARACEDAGLDGLFRSDHYSHFVGRAGGALDAWATIAALAAITERIQLGTLVSPATFRHPSVLARMVATASHVSGGRVELGIGAGWNEAEHREHGFPFPPIKDRLELLAEQLDIVRRSWAGERFDFVGENYELLGALPLPVPVGRVNVIVGGSAKPATVAAAVRFADEYNTALASLDEAREHRAAIDAACERAGRDPLTFSLMARCVVGEDRGAVSRRAAAIAQITDDMPFADPQLAIDGTVDEVVERLRAYEQAGVERVMLRHLLVDDLEMIELLGREVAPQLR
jgi:alkanesulfonate monooxygenase SsuD/methylene tetrahydromethanopterin reductase-like flavin-dependent oxidoreductase (luciferase family)